jgi:hypothetical protein
MIQFINYVNILLHREQPLALYIFSNSPAIYNNSKSIVITARSHYVLIMYFHLPSFGQNQ